MAITLTNEQQDFVAAIRDFCARECGTREQRDALDSRQHPHNAEIYKKMADLGWLGVAIPEEHGGSGGGLVDLCLFLEETARGMAPIGGFGVTMIVAGTYERFGTPEQKDRILGGIATGTLEAIAMSEPESGSDVGSLKCKAVREGDEYVINGQKTWISEAHLSEHILLVCRTDGSGAKHEGISMIEVPADAPGVDIRRIETMGGEVVNDVFFTDVRVPVENVLGQEGNGWMQLMSGLNVERLIIAALALGMAERAFDDLLAYVKEREQFGRPIGSFQALRHRIADLATELECCRLLTYDVAQQVDANPGAMFPREASMAKLKCTEVAKAVTLEGMQMMGGYGYATEYDMELHVRRSLVMTILGGTSEVQREIIGKTYGL
ncbi:acyl-CoA dehydrogenase [Conexibacter sp. W3-3-2]|uniref:Acyl-CoA dehydrogenase n=1 Tax=Paraconexibacter algicola TaxID=2133960 RepID=A0A2T4UGF8_9ACTN|nr:MULTISPECIES: acyl-CoA dehydrogenase family protein [Solirubrobacterales]MTD44574.1 acyl-CoA dehydrogenase [Conexibacter sp. W3-3-2]PTL58316.1 acyl-CoA dehydrogenase [Paraconexibacter algicola]